MDRVISALDDKDLPISIFMDLSNAFDTLDHTTLLHKLKYYGINGITLNWFNSYLSNRSQYVKIDNVLSTKMVINTGVSQGSILGPLLFLIYMNDIPNSSQAFRFVLYADDTTLFSTIEYTIPIDNSAHTDKLATRLSKYSGILNKLKNYLPPYILRTLYCSLVQSHLNYAILTWGYSCNRLETL